MNARYLSFFTSNKSNKGNNKASRDGKKFGLIFLIAIILSLVTVVSTAIGATVYIYKITSELPRLEKEALVSPAQTTKIYSSDGTLIADLHAEQNRVIVKLEDISPVMRKAIIAIEDERFYQHHGVDFQSIIRSILVDIRTGKATQGGSTITQQYVRNIYLTPEKTIQRKLKEMLLAYEVEKLYSKETILEKYLNTVYFGHGCYGVETASQIFFGKEAKDLSLSEAALLAGVVKGPAIYSPYKYPERAKNRRNLVLQRMYELGFINREEYDRASNAKIKVKDLPKEKYYVADYFVDYVKDLIIEKYGVDKVFKGGLRVYTTIDLKLQKHAEDAVFSTLDRPNDPDASLVAIDVKNGHILAMVGGKNFEKQKFNLAVQAKRQPGSSFKVFTLCAALEQGISPYSTYGSSPITIELPSGEWRVRNAGGGSRGTITVREGTIYSVNAMYARLVMDVGAENVVDVAKRMGITSDLKPFPSITLGSEAVSPIDMASAYSTLARGGKRIDPIAITKITDSKGRVIEENKPREKQAINPWIAYTVTDILEEVIRRGTGWRARIPWSVAGKTGTAQDYRDAWFVGYTPHISTSVWVGYKEAQISMTNIHGFARIYGGTIPAIIWKKFMSKAMEGKPKENFTRPELNEDVMTLEICVESGLRATPYCEKTRNQIFLKGKAPTDFCEIHKGIELPNLSGMKVDDAIHYLQDNNINVDVANQYSDKFEKGIVIKHSPKPKTPVKEGGLVKLYVSLGPKNPPPPPEETTETTSSQ